MLTKTFKKYAWVGLILAVCSTQGMATSETAVLTAAQYRPAIAATPWGLVEGIEVTGITLTGCASPAYLALPALLPEGTTGDEAPTPLNLHWHARIADILSKAKVASRSIEVTYVTGGTPECLLSSVIMQ